MSRKESILKMNLSTLSHGTELATRVVRNISGNTTANTVDGKTMSDQDIRNAVTASIANELKVNRG